MKNNNWATVILGITLLITAIIGVFSYLAPPALYPDPSWGFQTMRSMERGSGFNLLMEPDPTNIAKDSALFLTWWSPGQYLVPYLFKNLFNLNTGQASAITSVVCEIIGLLGFYAFFKKIGFKPILAATSVAFIACQQFYFIPYIFYNGGEVLMFAYAGWFLYGCFYFKKVSIPMLLFVLLAGWIGFFSKSSMMLVYAAGLLCMWINISPPKKDYAAWFKNGLAIGIPSILSLACIYILFLRKGDNPAASHNGWRLIWETFSFPIASPLLAGFSVDELTRGLVYHPDGPMFTHFWTIVILLVLAIVSILLVSAIVRKVPYHPYKIAVVVYYVVFVLFFGYSFFRQAAISYEGRHFRLVGLLVIPGALYLVSRANFIYRGAFALVWLFIAYISFSTFTHEYNYNKTEGIRGPSGLTQQFIDQPTLNYLLQTDQQQRNAIFVFTSADLGLEIKHNRILTLEPIGSDVKIDYQDYLHQGHAGPLYVVLPADYEKGGRSKFILKCFPGYKNFVSRKITSDYIIYEAK